MHDGLPQELSDQAPLDARLPTRYTSSLLRDIPEIRHGFFSRKGGVSVGLHASLNCSFDAGDHRQHVLENRDRVVQALEGSRLITNWQVHGKKVRVVGSETDTDSAVEADGLVTSDMGVCIGAMGADCAPVLLAAPGVVGAAHAGWLGALSGVTDAVLDSMETLGAQRDRIAVAIGPAIQSISYEVGDRFRERFMDESPINAAACFFRHAETGRMHFDLPGYIERRLLHAGIRQFDRSPWDTYSNDSLFFSFRRARHQGESVYGRQIGAVCLV